MPEMPTTREEIEAQMRALREERRLLDLKLAYNKKLTEAIQAVCDHPETYFRDIMGRDKTNICRVCGKHDVPAAQKEGP